MNSRFNLLAAIVVTVLVVVAMSMFTVDQRQYALVFQLGEVKRCLLYTSPSPRDRTRSRMPSSA